RAYRGARFMVVKADAFGALGRHDVIEVWCDRGTGCAVEFPWHSAGVNRRVGAFGLARSAIDAFARDRRRHLVNPGLSAKLDCDRLQRNSNNADLSGQSRSSRDWRVRRAVFAATWY